MNTASLLKLMVDAGIPFDGEIQIDGKFHRYSYKGGQDKAEWYIATKANEKHFYCAFGSWRDSKEFSHNYKSWEGDAELEYLDEEIEKIAALQEKEIALSIKEGTKLAKEFWERSDIALNHEYLARKQIKAHGAKIHRDMLLIPLYDSEGEFLSLQTIARDGVKRFAKNTKTILGRYFIGDIKSSKRVFVCEGFATGASIHEATGDCVAVSFSCHNLARLGDDLQRRFQDKSISLCADLGKAGDESKLLWKKYVNSSIYSPSFKGKGKETDKDFNDLACHKELGKSELKKQLCPPIKQVSLIGIMNEVAPTQWYVEHLIIKGSVNLIYGPAGAGKSAICHSLAFACSQGIQFWMYHPKKSKVLYIDGELSHSENYSRMSTILKRHENILEDVDEQSLSFITLNTIYETFDSPIDLYAKEWQARLDPIIKEFDIIFLDNISTLTGEGPDIEYENKASSWINVGGWLRKWKESGKSFVVVHHSNKAGGIRGTSRLSVDSMTQLRLEPIEIKDPAIDIHTRIVFEKRREISGMWKLPFEVILRNNQWDIITKK